MTSVQTRGTVTINVEQCKGCDLCIDACRPNVLTMSAAVNGHGYHYPELEAGCTACKACFDVCPDFVFEVYRYKEPVMMSVEPPLPTSAKAEHAAT